MSSMLSELIGPVLIDAFSMSGNSCMGTNEDRKEDDLRLGFE